MGWLIELLCILLIVGAFAYIGFLLLKKKSTCASCSQCTKCSKCAQARKKSCPQIKKENLFYDT